MIVEVLVVEGVRGEALAVEDNRLMLVVLARLERVGADLVLD